MTATKDHRLAELPRPAVDAAQTLARIWNRAVSQLEAGVRRLRIERVGDNRHAMDASEVTLKSLVVSDGVTINVDDEQADRIRRLDRQAS
jgi:hypothetical protein